MLLIEDDYTLNRPTKPIGLNDGYRLLEEYSTVLVSNNIENKTKEICLKTLSKIGKKYGKIVTTHYFRDDNGIVKKLDLYDFRPFIEESLDYLDIFLLSLRFERLYKTGMLSLYSFENLDEFLEKFIPVLVYNEDELLTTGFAYYKAFEYNLAILLETNDSYIYNYYTSTCDCMISLYITSLPVTKNERELLWEIAFNINREFSKIQKRGYNVNKKFPIVSYCDECQQYTVMEMNKFDIILHRKPLCMRCYYKKINYILEDVKYIYV